MDFDWTPEQLDLIDAATQFAESYFTRHPVSAGFDSKGWQACADHGILKLALPEAWDGTNRGLLTSTAVFETLGRHGADSGLLFALGAHLFGCSIPVSQHASPELQSIWGKKLASGQAIGALAVTEPGKGSDPTSMITLATPSGEDFIINGEKIYITNAPVADLLLVLSATKPEGGIFGLTAFLVENDTPGLRIEPQDETFGLKGAPMGRVLFEDCKVSSNNMLGKLNAGFHIFNKAMLWERAGILSGLLGVSQMDLDRCIQFINQHHDDNGNLGRNQAISHKVANMQFRLEAARLLVYQAAWSVDHGNKDVNAKVSMAKYMASEVLLENAIDSMRIQAGSGWVDPQGTATHLRDAIGTLFASGTSEIQLNIIASACGLKRR